MPLPTTNLTLHVDASDTDHIWENYQAGTPYHNTTPTDGGEVEVWDDDDGKDLNFQKEADPAKVPLWRSNTPLMELPCLDFDGSDDFLGLWSLDGVTSKTLADIISASELLIIGSFYLEAVTGTGTDPFTNEALLTDVGGYLTIAFRNNSGVYTAQFCNYDGTNDIVTLSVNLATSYVFAFWHTGGSIYAELYTSSGLVASDNVASGDTFARTGHVTIGKNYNATIFFNGRIGELAVYNAYSGTDKATAVTYFTNKWVPGAPANRFFILTHPA